MDTTDLEDLATVARESLASPPSPRRPVLIPAPFDRRILAAVVDGLVLFFAGAIVTRVLLVLAELMFNLHLFGMMDAGPRDRGLANWVSLATWAFLCLAYTAVEAFGGVTPGKRVAKLRVVLPDGVGRRRLVLRWALAYLPLLALALVCTAAATRTAAQDAQTFAGRGWSPDGSFLLLLLGLAALWGLGFFWALGPSGHTLAERASGVEVLCEAALPARGRTSGFDVAPPAPPPPTAAADPVPHP